MIKVLRILLLPFSILYGLLMLLRRKLFNIGLLKRHIFDFPIICIGNISLGGTGKTPHTEYLIRLLKSNFKIATLSRGYGRKTKGYVLATSTHSAEEIGDEPMQYKSTFYDEIDVAVCENRVTGINNLLALEVKPDIILLDDAYQHISVKAGLNILLTDYYNLYVNDYVIPTGTLREFKSNAKYAEVIVVTKCPKVLSPMIVKSMIAKIKPLSHQKICFSYYKYGEIIPLTECADKNAKLNFSQLLMVTGIANPYPLKEYLKDNCFELHTITFSDHHSFSIKDLNKIIYNFDSIFSKNKAIIITQKDAMRLNSEKFKHLIKDLPIYYIPLEVKFHKNYESIFNKMILNYVNKKK